MLSGECEQRFRFPSPVLRVQFHPRRENEVLVCPMKHAPVVVDLSVGSHKVLPLEDEVRAPKSGRSINVINVGLCPL